MHSVIPFCREPQYALFSNLGILMLFVTFGLAIYSTYIHNELIALAIHNNINWLKMYYAALDATQSRLLTLLCYPTRLICASLCSSAIAGLFGQRRALWYLLAESASMKPWQITTISFQDHLSVHRYVILARNSLWSVMISYLFIDSEYLVIRFTLYRMTYLLTNWIIENEFWGTEECF